MISFIARTTSGNSGVLTPHHLAVQLARKYAEFRSTFIQLVQPDPEIVHKTLYGQMKKLMVQPLAWNEPTLPGRVLKGFPSLTTLLIYEFMIPDELLGQISRGEFGRGIAAVHIWYPRCALSMIMSVILSLPDLKHLSVSLKEMALGQPSSMSSVAPRRLLDWLELWQHTSGVSEALVQSQFTSEYLCSGCNDSNAHRIIVLSSRTLVGLVLEGVQFSQVRNCRSRDDDIFRCSH